MAHQNEQTTGFPYDCFAAAANAGSKAAQLSLQNHPKKKENPMQVSDDRTHATLAINKTLTAPEIENLIRELATLRSQMTPEVTPAPKDNDGGGVPVMSQDNPTLAIQHPLKDAHVTVYLRSTGLGWTAWRLHPDTQRALAEFFNAKLPKSIPAKAKPIPFR